MAHSPSLLPLKLIVISLGFLLIGGTIFVAVTIASRVHKNEARAHCADSAAHLGAGAAPVSVFAQGDTVQVVMHAGGGDKVLTLDRCSGSVLHTLSILP